MMPPRPSVNPASYASPPHLSPGDIDALKRAHPITRVALERYGLPLTRVGTRLVGPCPFHQEAHPSFTLFPESNRFYCFGCRQGGDVIELVRLLEGGLSFRAACALLAGECVGTAPAVARVRANIGADDGGDVVAAGNRDRAAALQQARQSPAGRQALQVAARLYAQHLAATPAVQGYLARRGISAAVAQRAGLGYSPGDSLVAALRAAGVPLRGAWAVGLLVGREGRERFAGRLTIPEVRGDQAVWLAGRLLDETADAPRYMSLPGPRPLLGLTRIWGQPAVVVVEGAFDWLTLCGWGLPACAALGGTLPPEADQVLALARRIYLAFDRDSAGGQAARRLAIRLGARAQVVTLPAGVKDVNELGRQTDGYVQFRTCLVRAVRPRSAPIGPAPDGAPDREVA